MRYELVPELYDDLVERSIAWPSAIACLWTRCSCVHGNQTGCLDNAGLKFIAGMPPAHPEGV